MSHDFIGYNYESKDRASELLAAFRNSQRPRIVTVSKIQIRIDKSNILIISDVLVDPNRSFVIAAGEFLYSFIATA